MFAMRRRGPVEVNLNQTLAPLDILTFSASPGDVLTGLSLRNFSTDIHLNGLHGDGYDFPQLDDGSPLDVFVSHLRGSTRSRNDTRRVYDVLLRPGENLILSLAWQGVNGLSSPGALCVVWTAYDHAAGRRPYLSRGQAAEMISRLNDSRPLPRPLFFLRDRVPLLKRASRSKQFRMNIGAGNVPFQASQSARATELNIRGLRGFRANASLKLAQPTGAEGSGLTIVVGANNAGKSTLWEGFDALGRAESSPEIAFSEGRRNRHTPDGVNIELSFADGASFALQSIRADTSQARAEWRTSGGGLRPESLDLVVVPSRRHFQPNFGRHGDSRRNWMTANSDYSRIQTRDGFTGRLFDLHADTMRKAKFDELMSEVVGSPVDWSIELSDNQMGAGYYLKIATSDGVTHSSEGLGDGITSLLFILNALHDAEPRTLIVIDEPELSLHPHLVRRLGAILARYARDQQIVIFTHSPLIVSWDHVAAGAEIARVYKRDGESRLAQPSRDTVNEITRLRASNAWRTPHVLGSDANEALFLEDGLVIVEGQEDAALLPRVADLVGEPRIGSILGWGAGGADNIEKLFMLLEELGYQRVVALLDNNRPDVARRLRTTFARFKVAEIPAADIRTKPASTTKAVQGLLDESGKQLQPGLEEQTRKVLAEVRSYLEGKVEAV